MKKAMSNVDVAYLVRELQGLVGGHVGKAYQTPGETLWLTVQQAGQGRTDLLLEAGKRCHPTLRERSASRTPPQFPIVLRSQLSGGRIVAIEQHDFDRVLKLVVERAGERKVLVVELFPKGTIVLLEESGKIILPLRPTIFRERRILAGEEYHYPEGLPDPRRISITNLQALLASSETDLVRTLVRGLNMGGVYGEEVCLRAGVEKGKPAFALGSPEIERVFSALNEVFQIQELKPQIICQSGQPLDVVPFSLQVYQGLDFQPFPSFSQALDAFFVEQVPVTKPSPIERRLELQRKAIEDFLAQEQENVRAGEFIYQHYGEIEALLGVISSARSKGFTYPQIWERIRDSGLPESEKILSLDHQGEMRVALEGQELELCATLTVPQNAQRYYEKAKELAKKQEGAKIALQATLQLGREKAGPQKTRQAVSARRRKPKWYERFRWFVSSEGLLVIGGRDSDSNEEIYSKYLEKRDLAFHTDAPGAPLTVIKTEGRDVQEATLQEAAQFAVSYSNLWKAGLGSADCYMIRAEQVTKTPEPGEFLRKGAFVIRGERRYFRDAPLGIALGIARGMLIGGPISAVRARVLEAEDDQDGEKNEEGFIVEIEPGEYNPDDLAKRIYRQMLDKFEDKRYLKAIASQDQIVQFLPPGGSRVKGQSG